MPSRVRVAGLIGGRVYLGRQILDYLVRVADSAGRPLSNRKKGATWKDILAAWEVVGKYLDDNKLYVIRERRGVHPSRSLFNQKLLGYRRNKKKKAQMILPLLGQAQPDQIVWNDAPDIEQDNAPVEAAAPPPEQPRAAQRARYELQHVDGQGHIIYR